MAELEERSEYINSLADSWQKAAAGEGHTVFITGEAGIGKTSIVNYFVRQLPTTTAVLFGACDSLSTPRPLGPLYDIASQLSPQFEALLKEEKRRHVIFSSLINEIASRDGVVIVFEDIHWADEATLDLVKFLSRRIYRYRCLFMLTYRDDELQARHPLKTIFGELVPHAFSKMHVQRLSLNAVQQLAARHGNHSWQQIYDLTGGNPFYVTEILSNKGSSIPDRVKDAILAAFNSQNDLQREFIEFLSILPSRVERDIADRLDEDYPGCLEVGLTSGILVRSQNHFSFKHELFRITLEESLGGARRKQLHRKMLSLIQGRKFQSVDLSQLVHHAQYADEGKLVAQLAPRAAEEASSVGAHLEASKLYAIAIKFTDQNDPDLAKLYERHAYECYLTNQLLQAIESQQKALDNWRALKSSLKEGDVLRFLSRLWWFYGNRANAIRFAEESIAILENGFPTRERTMAYSNMAQLYMLSDNKAQTLLWGNRAIDLAVRMHDREIECHALNNVGAVLMRFSDTTSEGEKMLRQSLSIALEEDLHEHAARAYTNLSFSLVLAHRYGEAETILAAGLKYCEERDLNSWDYYMQSERIKLLLDTGKWNEAQRVSERLEGHSNHPSIIRISALVVLGKLKARRGDYDQARQLLKEALALAHITGEVQRLVPVLTAVLELCWLAADAIPSGEIDKVGLALSANKDHWYHYTMLSYWKHKLNLLADDEDIKYTGPFALEYAGRWKEAADQWHEIGCPYEEALALFEGTEDNRRESLRILDSLGATAVVEKLKIILKERGVKNIPRGIRESTKANPFSLTNRQMDVLKLLSEGLQNAEIGERLFISAKTVDHHISALFEKMEVNSRAKAVHKAQQLGLLKDQVIK